MIRILQEIFWVTLFLILITLTTWLTLTTIAGGAEVIPSQRHFIYKPSKWQFWHKDKTFSIEAYTTNSTDRPVTVFPRCSEIEISEQGEFMGTGRAFDVKPQRATVLPDKAASFVMTFPIPEKNSSVLFIFDITPEVAQTEGNVQVVIRRGWVGGITFLVDGKYEAKPVLSQIDQKIKLTNNSQWLLEGTLRFSGGNDAKHYFIQANKSRFFEIPSGADSVINHCGLLDRRQGLRLRQ